MIRMTRWMVLGGALLATSLTACGNGEAVDGDIETEGQQVRISSRFEITVPTNDVWAGVQDTNPNVSGTQVNVEVHAFYHANRNWANHGGERWTQYQLRTTGEENTRGIPRVVATTSSGAFRAIDGAFTIGGNLYLIGNSTGGSRHLTGGAYNTRNEKPVIIGVAWNNRASTDQLQTVANQEALSTFTFAPGAGQRVFDLPQFAQRWVDAGNEAFACYNINTTGGQFVSGTSPTDFRSSSRGFVLDGNLYAIGVATGGATAVSGVTNGFRANSPRRALANYNNGTGGVSYGITITSLPNAN